MTNRELLSGEYFNQHYTDIEFVKLLDEKEKCDNLYDGLNDIKTFTFYPDNYIVRGYSYEQRKENETIQKETLIQIKNRLNIEGKIMINHKNIMIWIYHDDLFFIKKNDTYKYIKYGENYKYQKQKIIRYTRKITIPNDAIVCIEGNKIITDKFVLGECEEIDTAAYMLAINYNELNLRYVPNHLITKELCDLAFKKSIQSHKTKRCVQILSMIPSKFIDDEMCLSAMNKNTRCFRHIPRSMRNKELSLMAIKEYATFLRFVPESVIDYEICHEAVKRIGPSAKALKYVPITMRGYDMCITAIKNSDKALKYVPIWIKNMAFCEIALSISPNMMRFVPAHVQMNMYQAKLNQEIK